MTVLFDVDRQVATITLHRPEARNAYTGEMGVELSNALARCDGDDDIRAVVITGTPPAFCAGADLRSGADTFRRRDEATFRATAVTTSPMEVRKPVIAAVNGHAIGIGLTLTLQCDVRFFADDATYGIVQVRRGVVGDALSHWTLPRVVGMANAADLLLSGRTFDGHEAARLGLCSRVLPNDEVLPASLAYARDLTVNTAPLSVAASKAMLWQSLERTPEEMEELETRYHHLLMGTPDAREGVSSFMEKRPPRWTGGVARDWGGGETPPPVR
jgi:enoyl-CoA hydratase/carnithine racemase